MKHSAIAGLFIAGALLASPVFAAEKPPKDLCNGNLQLIKDFITSQPSIPETSLNNVKQAHEKGMAAQAAGDDKACVEITNSMLTKMQIRDPTRN
ncbi:hypothetical protein GIW70_11420 [Pseudomonas syringae]|nr:hypothetical protein [Pseudomonas syringae]MCF5068792.1 hypothetical protein [Pseudomonas syringae]